MAYQRADHKRLMIRDMVLENFKSYAGEQQVGPFHKVWRNETLWLGPDSCLLDIYRVPGGLGSQLPTTVFQPSRYVLICQHLLSSQQICVKACCDCFDYRGLQCYCPVMYSCAVFFICGGSQRQWQVQRNRRNAVRLWKEGQAGIATITPKFSANACHTRTLPGHKLRHNGKWPFILVKIHNGYLIALLCGFSSKSEEHRVGRMILT